MLDYDPDKCAIWHILQIEGSVLPRTLAVAVPATLITIAFHLTTSSLGYALPSVEAGQAWVGYNAALGALIVFRTSQAYSRWWEGGTLLQQVRGEWYNAASNLIAFTTRNSAYKKQAVEFQHLLVRLMSMLYCSALQQVAEIPHDEYEILDTSGIEQDSIDYLIDSEDRCEVLVQWIQRLVVINSENGILTVPAPIVSRVFQELGRGMVNFNNVKKIKEFPFPFPYLQILNLLLVLQAVASPIANCFLVKNVYFASALTFFSVIGYWSINYIAQEIEHPFGTDPNDLPVIDMCSNMNRSLWVLLEKQAQRPPSFTFIPSAHMYRKSSSAIAMAGPRVKKDVSFVGSDETFLTRSQNPMAAIAMFDNGKAEATRGTVRRDRSTESVSKKSSYSSTQLPDGCDKERSVSRVKVLTRSGSTGSLQPTRSRRGTALSSGGKFQERLFSFVGDGQSDDEEPQSKPASACSDQRAPCDEPLARTTDEATSRCTLTNGCYTENAPVRLTARATDDEAHYSEAGFSKSTCSSASALGLRCSNPEDSIPKERISSGTSSLLLAHSQDCGDQVALSEPPEMRLATDVRFDVDKLPDHTSVVLTLKEES
eukprot:TRINITY_DN8612_c0_g3_i1.p1 TRINITY_DN8612_c0_g3~~TRINITY_DN8612_c0_g3_i1.p1  ORF type:complete len:618 (-),score=75.01 TRINITY_DN8612_c0_g3_i1:111-1904(-)